MVKKNTIVRNILLIIAVLILMVLIVFLVGRSFGFFQYEKKGDVVNVIAINGIDVKILNKNDDALNLTNAYPVYDSDGLNATPFEFTITNTSSKALDYVLKIVNDTEKQDTCFIDEEEETACPLLTTDNIRFSYSINNGTYSEPANLGVENGIIDIGTIAGKQTITYSIKLWIKSDAANDIMNHYFFGQLLIQGGQYTSSGAGNIITDQGITLQQAIDDIARNID